MNFDGAQQVGVFILIVIALLPSIKTIFTWVRGERTEIYPQPITVKPSIETPTINECKLKHAAENHRIESLETSVENIREFFTKSLTVAEDHHSVRTDALRKEIKDDIGGVHSRISAVFTALNRIEGKLSNTGAII